VQQTGNMCLWSYR